MYINHKELDRVFSTVAPLKKHNWEHIYGSVDAILTDLKSLNIKLLEEVLNPNEPLFSGCEYIFGFARQLKAGKDLSDKQITQCKRLAKEIKKAHLTQIHIYRYNPDIEFALMSNQQILDRYEDLKRSINCFTQYIESYKQQKDAEESNKIIENKISRLIEILLERSNGICKVKSEVYEGVGLIDIIKKKNADDIVLIVYNNRVYSLDEFQNKYSYTIERDSNNQIKWMHPKYRYMDELFAYYDIEQLDIIAEGWVFEVHENSLIKIYMEETYLGEISYKTNHTLRLLKYYCEETKKTFKRIR